MTARVAAIVVLLLSSLTVIVRAAGAPSPPASRRLDPGERAAVAAAIAAREPEWAAETTRGYPFDRWSQSDDFHGREFRLIQQLAREHAVSVEEVLRAIDEDLHRRGVPTEAAPDDRHARAVPCKPRPFYD